MKKLLFIAFMLLAPVVSIANTQQVCGIINLGIGFDDPTNGEGPLPKSPILVPTVSQDGYEITFTSSHPVYTLYIIEDDVVVYSVVVSSTTTSVLLPSWLSGDYVLYLQPEGSSYYFYGDITL